MQGTNSLNFQNQHEQESQWKQALEEVNTIADRLGMGVDKRIKTTVAALRVHGFPTTASCEGHPDIEHGLDYPWIDVYFSGPEMVDGMTEEARVKLQRECRIAKLPYLQRLIQLLDEFYSTRKTHYDALLLPSPFGIFGGFRLHSMGADIMELLDKAERMKKHKEYVHEMNSFGEFLKEKFLEGKDTS